MSIWMIFRTPVAPTTADESGNGGSWVFLLARGNDPQRAVRKRPLQRLGLVPWRSQPDVMLLGRRQDHRHRFGMHLPYLGVRFARQKREDVGSDLAFLHLPPPGPVVPEPSK